ncbi:protein lifeguard 2-like isoform X2 [Pygocentrus nattereri]|uniref:Protein lifeguard 2 n=1 Tax=Pygocentrus nattereri TaxID=42514 RepID=A0AAR2JYZ2_PYGNA|nr:protein lifeguard 2-like isoform X2 [Pygocentrus nattereri]
MSDKVSATIKLNNLAPPSYEEATAAGSPSHSGSYPGDGDTLTEFCWDDQNIRRIFIRKVYAILSLQLSSILAIVTLFTLCDPVKEYVQSNPGWYWAAYVLFIVTYMTLYIFSRPRRTFPWNVILLAIFTLALAFMTGLMSSYFKTMSVMICLGITAFICLSITIFSFQTKIDLTSVWGMLCISCTALSFWGLLLAILLLPGRVPWMQVVFAGLGAILFCMFLAFDTQRMMGKKRYTISPEEYIFAALNIYLDIAHIFTFILLCRRQDSA